MLKNLLKALLLEAGLYYAINDYRFRADKQNNFQKTFYGSLIGSDDLVFDVGANIGQRATVFSQLAKRVVAFEPQPKCVKHLKSRFMFTKNVVIEHIALSDVEGKAVIYESSAHTLTSMSRKFIDTVSKDLFKEYEWKKGTAVKTDTLDHAVELHGEPKFIKIDVEGFELNVLNGLSYAAPFISFEFTPQLLDEARSCVQRIHNISNDYHYNYCLGENWNFQLENHADYSTFVDKILPEAGNQGCFGDIYAILKK